MAIVAPGKQTQGLLEGAGAVIVIAVTDPKIPSWQELQNLTGQGWFFTFLMLWVKKNTPLQRTPILLLEPQGNILCNMERGPILVAVCVSPDGCLLLYSQLLFSPSPSYRRTALTMCLSCQKPSEPFKTQMDKIWMGPMASKGSCALAINHLDWNHRFQLNLEIHSLPNLPLTT